MNMDDGILGTIDNRTFDELRVGDRAAIERTLGREDIDLFAAMSGDVNPAHMDEEYARDDLFHSVVGHGMWVGALISTVLGTELPGPGSIYLASRCASAHRCASVTRCGWRSVSTSTRSAGVSPSTAWSPTRKARRW
jgi:acyl dehydratase